MHDALTILSRRFWPDRHGGIEQHMYHLATEAVAHLPVQVLCENRTDAAPDETMPCGVRIHRGPVIPMGRLWRWPHIPVTRWWMQQLRRQPPQGWVWVTDPMAGAAAILTGHGDRLIYNPPGCWAAMQRTYRTYPHIATMRSAWGYRMLERFVYRRAARMLVASDAIARQYALMLGARTGVTVVPRGAGEDLVRQLPSQAAARQVLGLPRDGFVIGFVGRLDPCKDLPHLIQAAARPGVLTANDRILIVGTGEDLHRIHAYARHHDLLGQVVLPGQLAGPALHAAYAAMDTFVLPSLYEGYGMVILEAMAAGVPVVGRPGDDRGSFTSMAEMIQPGLTGLLMDAHDVGDLGDKLRWLRENPVSRRAMGEQARARLAQRPWSAVIGDYLENLGVAAPAGVLLAAGYVGDEAARATRRRPAA